MGWCNGSYIAEDIWELIKTHIPQNKQREIALKLIDMFDKEDADCWENNMSIVQDGKPDWYEED